MRHSLRVSIGQSSDAGPEPINQDFHGALADVFSSSEVSQIGNESAVRGFLGDYCATSETWSAKTAVYRILRATNSWLFA